MKYLQLGFYTLFLITTVGFLLAVINTTYHLPHTALWVTLAITAAIVFVAVLDENTTNQKEEEE